MSLINHRKDYSTLQLHEDYLQVCNGNICQALILSILEAGIDQNPSNIGYVPMNYKDFMHELFNQYTRQTTSVAINQLLERGLIERRTHTELSYEYVYDYRINLTIVQEQINQLPLKAWDIFGGLCAYCRVIRATTWDHIIPKSKNGRGIKSNLVPACRQCNMLKKDQDVREWMKASGITPCAQLVEILNKITQNNNADEVVESE
jgi:hypothetical protein